MSDSEPSYIDYEAFLDPNFSPTSFANSLVLATNNSSDTSIDLSTPLSRVLFDIQEIDKHIHKLSTRSAIPLLSHTKQQADAGRRIVSEVEAQIASLTGGYERLEKEVIQRFEAAQEVQTAAERLWQTVEIGRAVGRCVLLGRQLEAQMAEVGGNSAPASGRKEDHKAMIRASRTFISIRALLSASGPGEEGEHLDRINLISSLQNSLLAPSDSTLRTRSQQIIREFSMSSLSASSTATYAQSEETKARTTSAVITLCLLSPQVLLSTLQAYLRTCLTSSLTSIARALANLPTLDRTLQEVSIRCQNIVALESLLENIKPPPRSLDTESEPLYMELSPGERPEEINNLLRPLLAALDTSSLPSFFWRTMAESLAPRVADLVSKGGQAARALKAQKDRVRDSIRECVLRGSQGLDRPTAPNRISPEGVWEREAAVMVGSVLGALGR